METLDDNSKKDDIVNIPAAEFCKMCKYKEYKKLYKIEGSHHLGNFFGCGIISLILLGLLFLFGTDIWKLFFKFVRETL